MRWIRPAFFVVAVGASACGSAGPIAAGDAGIPPIVTSPDATDAPSTSPDASAPQDATDASAHPDATDAPASQDATDAPAHEDATDAPAPQDATDASTGPDATDAPPSQDAADAPNRSDSGTCNAAHRLWFDDFETGDYRRWTSQTYGNDFGNNCQNTALSSEQSVSPTHSERSEVVCAYSDSQRGYGGLQFNGDQLVPAYTNTGTGIDAPNGIVTIQHLYLVTPTVFQNGTWLSIWGMDGACDWSDAVLSIGFEDPSNRLAAAHYQEEGNGTRTFMPDAPSFPRGRWVRVTVYLNFYTGDMFIWQDGQAVSKVTFQRPLKTICQFHWGIYASHDNDNIVLFEDDYSIWKLDRPLADFSVEPLFTADLPSCQ